MIENDPDWLAVYLEFGRRLRTDAELRERWKTIAPAEARERSKAWIVDAQAAGRFREDVAAEDVAGFLGVVIDGVASQRALGFEPPDTDLVLRLTADALRPVRERDSATRNPASGGAHP